MSWWLVCEGSPKSLLMLRKGGESRTAVVQNSGLLRWCPPTAGRLRVSTNVAFWRGQTGVGRGGVGAVIRDCGDQVVASAALQIKFVADASSKEMPGILLSVELIKRCGLGVC